MSPAFRMPFPAIGCVCIWMVLAPCPARAVAPDGTAPSSIDTTFAPGGPDEEPRRKLIQWNEFDGPVSSFRFGGGLLLDLAAYTQDDDNRRQIPDLKNEVGVRDFRVLFKGKFKTERNISWTFGYMYDGAEDTWRFRQTGFDVGVPELRGHFFLGRTKEGYSNVKVMVGYHGWTMERSPALDAFVPILADGLKWMGYFRGPRVHYSLAWYHDVLSEKEKFSTYDHQFVSRVVWQPILSSPKNELLHLGWMLRDGRPDEGMIQIRSRPEANMAPYFVDTGRFASDRAGAVGVEGYYRKGRWLLGSEYNWQWVDATNADDPAFHAGDAVVAVNLTGETRPYNAPDAFFQAVSPTETVFGGGRGAVEVVLHFSYADFDDKDFTGGKLWRLTPILNWHMSDNVRLEFGYGYSMLDRFDLTGATQFFQFRSQTIF